MGLKITNEISTNKGVTPEMYVNIENISLSKNHKNSIMINKYLNKAARDANQNDICQCFEFTNLFILDLDVQELSSNYLYDLGYTKLKEILISKGLTVEDLI
jgi:hypothetical protein